MSTAHKHLDLARTGAPAATLLAAWSISGGKRLVWSLTVADTSSGPAPIKAEAELIEGRATRSLLSAAADDVDLAEDPSRSMLHVKVRSGGIDKLLATFRREEAGWRPCYAYTTLLAGLGLAGGRYEFDAGC